jgi:hypothetical protein
MKDVREKELVGLVEKWGNPTFLAKVIATHPHDPTVIKLELLNVVQLKDLRTREDFNLAHA